MVRAQMNPLMANITCNPTSSFQLDLPRLERVREKVHMAGSYDRIHNAIILNTIAFVEVVDISIARVQFNSK